jgi:uncharacterized damage-inducible protein DinB
LVRLLIVPSVIVVGVTPTSDAVFGSSPPLPPPVVEVDPVVPPCWSPPEAPGTADADACGPAAVAVALGSAPPGTSSPAVGVKLLSGSRVPHAVAARTASSATRGATLDRIGSSPRVVVAVMVPESRRFDTKRLAGSGRGAQDGGMAEHRAFFFVDPATDPREGGPTLRDEKGTLQEYLRAHRLTLELKCADLDAEQLARRSVPPSTMSLLGLVRHLAHVERVWFRIRCAQQDVPLLYQTPEDPDGDFNGAVADPAVVEEAWARWREEVAFAEQYVAGCEDLSTTYTHTRTGELFSMRELLVHMIEEYARHNGHADFLRECVDGRVGM